jgi:hypothetical protein
MDTGLDVQPFKIVEPWTDLDNDVCHYLYDRGIKFDMYGASDGSISTVIYSTNITPHEALQIKLIFPGISVTPVEATKKVSTLARQVCENITER